ncbi:MAG: NAD(+) synthase [Bacteroidia bacterium]|jgi:NAD+ synthase|nr:NAD(+) synthase [Bacteroidia bacterium]
MKAEKVIEHIVDWLRKYSESSGTQGFVIGISGGIDSAVTSTLCAKTGKKVMVLNMPIHQFRTQIDLSNQHIAWLKTQFPNVESQTVDLSPALDVLSTQFPNTIQDQLTMANTRARLRMLTLYAFATHHKLLVAGTGNKIEDFGIGFFTKYGDGGVDLSPIADLTKTEVFELAKHLNIVSGIQNAKPTDGLFEDGRSDEDEIGASYPELEWAMAYSNSGSTSELNSRQKQVLEIYTKRNKANRHKMEPIPVCLIPEELKS